MPLLLLKDLPHHDCLMEAAREFPDLDPSATEAFLHLLHASDESFRVVEAHLAEHELSQGRFGVLMALWGNCQREGRAAPLSPAELAARTGVTRATMTGLVDMLTRDGLVKREPAPDDRRMLCVRLTPRAEKLLRDLLPRHFKLMAALMSSLTELERTTLVRLLGKITTTARSMSSASAIAEQT